VDAPLGSRYVLHELLGRGAMGQVFRGTVRGSGAPVAVKVLKPELVSDTEVVARFFRERSILTSIDHPNVAQVLDLVVEGETLGIVMELVEGQDLRRYLRARGTLPPAEAVYLTGQLLQGLTAVHAAGIVHRDVKPENVLVSMARGQVILKLTDFGVSRLSYGASLTKMTSLIGTPEYMAPELADHDRATPAADLYSAGIVLYEMLAGRTPFAGGHPLAVLRRQVDQAPPPVPDVPTQLWAQIESLLAKDPRNRPESATATLNRLAPLQASLAGLPALPPMPDCGPEAATHPGTREHRVTSAGTTASPDDGSGLTVLRSRNREQMYASAPESAGRRRTRRRDRRRAAVLALPATLIILAAAFGVLLTRSPHVAVKDPSVQPTASYSFGPQQYRDGLLIVRRWTLSGQDGSLLTEAITATSATGKTNRVKFVEPIPVAIAASLRSVRFRPAVTQVIQTDPLVQWNLSLPSRGTIDIGYQAAVAPAGATQARLAQWAQEFDALQVSLKLPKPVTIGIRSLAISPATLHLGQGASAPLALSGVLSNGQAAPLSLLGGAAWSTSNAAVAAVDAADAILAVGPGTAVIKAQLGAAQASVLVTVTGTPNVALGANPATADTGSGASSPAGHQASSPAAGNQTSTSPGPGQTSPAVTQTSPAAELTSSSPAPAPVPATSTSASPSRPATHAETTGGVTHTWTDYSDAGGSEGASIPTNATVQIACKVTGFKVADGNTWWYRIASSPWSDAYYASADAFYNNGQTSGSLSGTPFVDPNVPNC
jgi:serine/threonine protein kinase